MKKFLNEQAGFFMQGIGFGCGIGLILGLFHMAITIR